MKWQLILELTLKSVLILSLAGLVSVWLRNTSAAFRHLIWSFALVSVLLLPAYTWFAPAWQVAILPPDCAPNCKPLMTAPAATLLDDELLIAPVIALPPQPTSPALPAPIATATTWSFDALQVILSVWGIVAVFLLARLALGTLKMRRITRDAQCLTDYHWTTLMSRLRGQLQIQSHISLYASEEVTMPVTWGIFRPVVLLPAESFEWSVEWRQIVLLHELAHIKRRDCLTQLLANLACAVYWFNPLVWMAARRLRVEREQACDDCVLEIGTRASDYAAYLVEIARTFEPNMNTASVSVGMACSQLESRVRAILDPALNRQTLSGRGKAALALVLAGGLLPLASLQATSQDLPKPPLPPVSPAAPEVSLPELSLELASPEIKAETEAAVVRLTSQQNRLVTLQKQAETRQLSALESQELVRVQSSIAEMQDELRGKLVMVSPPDPIPVPAPVAAPAPIVNMKSVVEISTDIAILAAALQDAKQKDKEKDKDKEDGLSADNLVRLKLHNVTPEYIESIRKAGFDDISVRQIVDLKVQNITPEFIRQAQGMSTEKLSVRDVIQLKVSGLTPEFGNAMKQAGVENVSLRKLMQMRMVGVTPEFVAAMKRAGFENLSPEQLTQLKVHGVTEDYVRQTQSWGLGKLSAREVIETKIHNVKPEDAQTLKALGFETPSLRDLTQVRIFGVTESYVKELRSLGMDNLTLRQVLQLKQHGVDGEYIRKMRAAGFKNISANDVIKMKVQGIDAILLKN